MDQQNNIDAINFSSILNNFGLKNNVKQATHNAGHILDLVIDSIENPIVGSVNVEPQSTVSDHRIVSFQIQVNAIPKNKTVISFRNYNCLDQNNFSNHLSANYEQLMLLNCPHSTNLSASCVNCKTDSYKNAASSYIEQNAPIVHKTIMVKESGGEWYNADIRQAKKVMRKAEKLYLKHGNEYYEAQFRLAKQAKCNLVTAAKCEYYKAKIGECTNDSSKLYRVLNKLLGKTNGNIPLPTRTNDFDLANDFSMHFLLKVRRISDLFNAVQPSSSCLIPDYPVLPFSSFMEMDTEQVLCVIRKVNKTNCANDPFNMRKIRFEAISTPIANIFTDIVNSSFSTGVFPVSENYATVKPLLKSGKDKDELSSYRPLYNTSFLSKVLETACLLQLNDHLSKIPSLQRLQSAYRRNHSVETAVMKVYNDLILNKSQGKDTILVLLDLSAAFDTVDHDILLNDLFVLGIDGTVLEWFKSYLRDRKFKVCISDTLSNECEMKTGVPQGSILGPILFLIYTIELHYVLESLGISYHCYADDTQIYFSFETINEAEHKLGEIFHAVDKWMSSRRLKLNSDKTECILISTNSGIRRNLDVDSIMLGTTSVGLSKSVRNLGFILDNKLTLSDQINNVKRKVIVNLINISRVAKFIDEGTRMKLMHGLVLSVIDFCNALYYDLPNYVLNGLQMLINSAARIVVGLPRFSRERITPICIKLHILPIKARIKYKICLLTHKVIKYGEPLYLNDLIDLKVPSSVNLRSNNDRLKLAEYRVPGPCFTNRCFKYNAPTLYNSLPLTIRQLDTIETFKKKLKTLIFKETFNLEDATIRPSFAT